MKTVVLKFGGTSVGSIEKIVTAARIIKKKIGKDNKIIVVVSAMSGKTNELIKQSEKISKKFNNYFCHIFNLIVSYKYLNLKI